MARRGGWRRLDGKRFRYEDARGRAISDEDALERIQNLAIPPAWKEVWISSNPRAKLQATGVDAAGRRQYLYHPAYRAAQEEKKYERLVRFGEHLPDLRKRMATHLELEPLEPDWTAAIAVEFVNRAWFRVGWSRGLPTSVPRSSSNGATGGHSKATSTANTHGWSPGGDSGCCRRREPF